MSRNHKILLYIFGITACLAAATVANEAIIGGDFAAPNQFPYQVSLLIRGQNFLCSGGIIGDQFILTSAHCVIGANDQFIPVPLNITAGRNNLQQNGPPTITASVDKIYVPREYNPAARVPTGDIAVLRLRQSLALHFHRNLIALVLPENDEDFVGQRAVIAGWGWNHLFGGIISNRLRFARADLLSHEQRGYPRGRNPHNHICARIIQRPREPPRGICFGDNGGPLVQAGIVIGIVSMPASDCSELFQAATYTRVSSYLDFIEDAVLDRRSDNVRVHNSPSR